MYRKDRDKLKLMLAISLTITSLVYFCAIVGINTFPIIRQIFEWSPLPILYTFISILLHDRFQWSIDSAYKIFLFVLISTIALCFSPISIPSTPILMVGVVFGVSQAILHYSKKFNLASASLMLSIPSYTICIFAISENLIELGIFSAFSTKAFIIIAFEIAKRQTGDQSSILVLKQKLHKVQNDFSKIEKKMELNKKLAEIGQMSTMVAHDLRNPLQSITTSIFYLKKFKIDAKNEKFDYALNMIESSIHYSNNLINELLEYSSNIQLEVTKTKLQSIINQAISMSSIPKDISIINESKVESTLYLDVNKILRVFTNVIKNAIDVMPDGGILTITSGEVKDMVEICFSDTGCGISKENLKKIMNPFFTTKAKGIGLGLAICQRIVESHKGKITIESELKKGTTICIILPKIISEELNRSNQKRLLTVQN